MKPLIVQILGSGNAAGKHRAAYAALPQLFEVTESADADIIDICSINSVHFMHACQALNNGQHIIVEKPVCGSLAECDLLHDLAEQKAGRIFPISQYRFAGHEPLEQTIVMRWRRCDDYFAGWRNNWETALGGSLTIHGIHAIDLAIQEFGMPPTVSAQMDTLHGPERFADLHMGPLGLIDAVRIITFAHSDIDQGGFYLGDSHTGFVNQFKLIHNAIVNDAPAPVDLDEARQAIEVLTAAYWSVYVNAPVILPIKPDHPFFAGWSETFRRRAWQR